MEQFGHMNRTLCDQLEAIDAELVELAWVTDVLAWWVTAMLELKHEVIRVLMDITIEYTGGPQAKFNPEFVTVEWKI